MAPSFSMLRRAFLRRFAKPNPEGSVALRLELSVAKGGQLESGTQQRQLLTVVNQLLEELLRFGLKGRAFRIRQSKQALEQPLPPTDLPLWVADLGRADWGACFRPVRPLYVHARHRLVSCILIGRGRSSFAGRRCPGPRADPSAMSAEAPHGMHACAALSPRSLDSHLGFCGQSAANITKTSAWTVI